MKKLIVSLMIVLASFSGASAVSFPTEGLSSGSNGMPGDPMDLLEDDLTDEENNGELYGTIDELGTDLGDEQPTQTITISAGGRDYEGVVFGARQYSEGELAVIGVHTYRMSATGTLNGSSVTAPYGYLFATDPTDGTVCNFSPDTAQGDSGIPIFVLPVTDGIPAFLLLAMLSLTYTFYRRRLNQA